MITAHDLVAREHVLESTRQHVMHTRLAISSWWAFVKYIFRSPLAFFEGFLEDFVLLPEIQHTLFHGGDIEFGRYWLEHGCSPEYVIVRIYKKTLIPTGTSAMLMVLP